MRAVQARLGIDDLNLIRAIADSGSLSAAARRLAVDHSSAFRRLGALERSLSARLFDRSRAGYTPTPAGEAAIATARRLLDELDVLHTRLAGTDMRPFGVVRLTTTDTLVEFLAPMLAAFKTAQPEITVELVVSNAFFTLSRRDADVALRPATTVPEHLMGRRAATLATCLYGTSALRRAVVAGKDVVEMPWVAPDESLSHLTSAQWIARHVRPDRIVFRSNTLLGLATAARQGLGVAALPCYLGDRDARLKRLGPVMNEMASALWLLTHPDLRRVARIRTFMAYASSWLDARRPQLESTGPSP